MTMTDTTSPTDRVLNAVSNAGIPFPAEIAEAGAAVAAIRVAQDERMPDPPVLPGVIGDVTDTVDAHAKAMTAHTAAVAAVTARRAAAVDLQPVAEGRLAHVVSVAAPDLVETICAEFNTQHALMAAAGVHVHDEQRLRRLDQLLAARLAAGAICGDPAHAALNALVVFDIEQPPAAGPARNAPSADRLYRWTFVGASHERWTLNTPGTARMVDPAGVRERIANLEEWRGVPVYRQRQPSRMGAAYDPPVDLLASAGLGQEAS